MKRYNIDIVPHSYGEPPCIRESVDGKWAYADDAQKELDKAKDLIRRMARDLKAWNQTISTRTEIGHIQSFILIFEAEAMTKEG